MGKIKHFIDSDQANETKICLPTVNNLPVEANVGKACLSSFGGLAILKGEEQHLALASQLASCVTDKRNPLLIHHTLEEIIMTRIFQICLGYEDVNDCDRMRKDPMMQLAVNSGELDKDLCSSATMCRFENMVSEEDLLAIQEMFVTMFVLSYNGKTPKKIILDCDDTNVDTYGVQELTLFNSYYDSYCYMPLLVFEGFSGKMILPLLKPGRRNKTANICDTLKWLVACLRQSWPETEIIVRGDSHFCSHEFMDWVMSTKQYRLYYITGLASNNVLNTNPVVVNLSKKVKEDYEKAKQPVKRYSGLMYRANTWTYYQFVAVKAEITEKGELNIRFIVTNMGGRFYPQTLYEYWYYKRGGDELYIRQFKEAVNGDRLSCHTFKANRLRIFLYAAAYVLLHSVRERVLKGTSMEKATLLRMREQLLLVAVCVRVLKTKVILDYPKHVPRRQELCHALEFYQTVA